jgi:hypothetical protein
MIKELQKGTQKFGTKQNRRVTSKCEACSVSFITTGPKPDFEFKEWKLNTPDLSVYMSM